MSERTRTILVDMDNVLADFDQGVSGLLQRDYPNIPLPAPRRDFYYDHDVAPEHRDAVKEIQNREGFFAGLQLTPWAVNGLQRIINYGYTPQICTAAMDSNPTCEAEKAEWVERYLSPSFSFLASTMIIDHDKHLYDGLALIDDKPGIPNAAQATWTQIVFSQPYNKHLTTPHRLESWMDKSLPKKLKLARDEYQRQT